VSYTILVTLPAGPVVPRGGRGHRRRSPNTAFKSMSADERRGGLALPGVVAGSAFRQSGAARSHAVSADASAALAKKPFALFWCYDPAIQNGKYGAEVAMDASRCARSSAVSEGCSRGAHLSKVPSLRKRLRFRLSIALARGRGRSRDWDAIRAWARRCAGSSPSDPVRFVPKPRASTSSSAPGRGFAGIEIKPRISAGAPGRQLPPGFGRGRHAPQGRMSGQRKLEAGISGMRASALTQFVAHHCPRPAYRTGSAARSGSGRCRG